jgi:hypothetical protein
MTDPDTLRQLAPIAAEREAWSPAAVARADEAAILEAWRQAPTDSVEQDALTELLSEKRKEANA